MHTQLLLNNQLVISPARLISFLFHLKHSNYGNVLTQDYPVQFFMKKEEMRQEGHRRQMR